MQTISPCEANISKRFKRRTDQLEEMLIWRLPRKSSDVTGRNHPIITDDHRPYPHPGAIRLFSNGKGNPHVQGVGILRRLADAPLRWRMAAMETDINRKPRNFAEAQSLPKQSGDHRIERRHEHFHVPRVVTGQAEFLVDRTVAFALRQHRRPNAQGVSFLRVSLGLPARVILARGRADAEPRRGPAVQFVERGSRDPLRFRRAECPIRITRCGSPSHSLARACTKAIALLIRQGNV